MNDKLTDEQAKEILDALNKAIADGPWDRSNFLKVVGKNLTAVRDDFLSQLGASTQAQLRIEQRLANQQKLRTTQREVYVALYSSNGMNMLTWERIVVNLPTQMISRPIYALEDDIKEAIKAKENKINEAYVAIYINESDILEQAADKVAVDRLGKSLLYLKDKTLSLDNITRFVHHSGVYKLEKNHLVKI